MPRNDVLILFRFGYNIAMVMGLLPVIGVPLPLVSYGGTSMLTLLMGFGLLFSIHIHQETRLPGTTMQMR